MLKLVPALAALLAVLSGSAAFAQDYPVKPLRFLIPYTPGGSPDVISRIIGTQVSEVVKQPVLVENRPGADGLIAIRALLQAPADGYTVLYTAYLTIQLLSLTSKNADFKVEDFRVVGTSGIGPTVFGVSKSLGVKNLAEFVAHARAKPGSLNYGATSPSLELVNLRFLRAAGIKAERIGYKGSVVALTDMAGGLLQMYMDGAVTSVPQHKQGNILILAIAGEKRMAALPDIPTFKEQGYPTVVSATYTDFFVPSKTPDAVARKLSGAFGAAIADPGIQKKMTGLSREFWPGPLDEYIRHIDEVVKGWGEDIRLSGIKAE